MAGELGAVERGGEEERQRRGSCSASAATRRSPHRLTQAVVQAAMQAEGEISRSFCRERKPILGRGLTPSQSGRGGTGLEPCDRPLDADLHAAKPLPNRGVELLDGILGVREHALAVVKVHERLGRPRARHVSLHDGRTKHVGS